jgi:hypothetical protein
MTTFMGVRAAPFVPDRGPEPPSTRAQIEAFKRRVAAARVRPYNRVAAAELESPHVVLAEQWRAVSLARERDEAVARVRRQVAAERRAEEFAAARAGFRLQADRARFMESRSAARALLARRAGGPAGERARGGGGEDIRVRSGGPVVRVR